MSQDRVVHASYPGMEIVRYDRAGKWYLEPTLPRLKRQAVTVHEAAEQAVWGVRNANGEIHYGRYGGSSFARAVVQCAEKS